jgi:hypothetical protein
VFGAVHDDGTPGGLQMAKKMKKSKVAKKPTGKSTKARKKAVRQPARKDKSIFAPKFILS